MSRPTASALGAVLVAVAVTAGLRAQTQGRADPADLMPALLSEVRGLRAALEQMATAGARVQLALGRVQLQEQRVNTAIRRLDDTRARLADAQRMAADQQDSFDMIETALREGRMESTEERQQMEFMLRQQKRQTARHAADIQRLTAEEAALASDVANEQARWMEFNGRLEDLERVLGR